MTLHFFLRYKTRYGQQIFIASDWPDGDKDAPFQKVAMRYFNEELWDCVIELPEHFRQKFSYYYIVENEDGLQRMDGEGNRFLDFSARKKHPDFTVIDTWNEAGDFRNIFYTKVFKTNGTAVKSARKTTLTVSGYTHEFRVKVPELDENETVCLLGSTEGLRNWDTTSPVLFAKQDDWYIGRVKLEYNGWPASYKFGVYNTAEKRFVRYEDGDNRLFRGWELKGKATILHEEFIRLETKPWRGTGINIPVFSLRSKKSFGVGEFTDLKLLIDWCSKTGVEMIQLLPINDTSAQNNWKDSYPYAAISAYALHPIYLNLEKVAGSAGLQIVKKLSAQQKQLNALPQVDYEQVMKAKRSAMRELYDQQKDVFAETTGFKTFFEENHHWLVPYAAFCYLKEKYKTADFQRWKKFASFDASSINKLVSSKQKHYHQIAIYYFEQYHLYIQLKEMVQYAHKNRIKLKGDLPIGIYRYSCDAWMDPSLYNLDEQAGAPPDDFSSAGQNWGFPTYNWEKMEQTGFKWWQDRFKQLGYFFDAFRIDHILGFFRIWSIPLDTVEGALGRFVPAIPIDIREFESDQIYFDYNRYCNPYITDNILQQLFGNKVKVALDEFVVRNDDGTYSLRDVVRTQKKALQYLKKNKLTAFKNAVFALISNVILLEEKESSGTKFHFRIDMLKTQSFKSLDDYTKGQLQWLYNNYFYERQDYFWEKEAMKKLPFLKRGTEMLVCGEDLGMVPHCVPEVMKQLGILGLNVERMPKAQHAEFFEPHGAVYLSIVQPSTHDMSTIRGWWKEDAARTRRYYNEITGLTGEAPEDCNPALVREIISRHLQSPAMWSIFLLQDVLAMSDHLRAANPDDERINVPADSNHYWRYRMHINLEDLIKEKSFNEEFKKLIQESGRLHIN